MHMLEFKAISKHYGSDQALAHTDLKITNGETTVLIGPSGCGKSTLLRMATGIIQPDTGYIIFAGIQLNADNITELRQRMGYVIQEGGLFPHITIERNVTLMARYLRWPADRINTRLSELTELVQLPTSLLHRYPAELSGGQRQRVSLMRALMLNPELLLLDEPLGALDPVIRYELQKELKEIFTCLGKTVIIVTHDISEAAFFSDTLILMRNGIIVQKGRIKELVKNPSDPFVTQFINAQREPMQLLNEALA